MKFQLLMIFSLLGLGSAWNQPSTCYVRQSICSSDSEIRGIRETLVSIQETLKSSLTSISASLQQLAQDTTTNPPTESATTTDPPTEPATTTDPPTEPATTTDPPTEPATTTDPPTEPATTTDPPTEPATTTDPPTEPATTTDPPTEPATTTEMYLSIGTFEYPAISCNDIPQDRPSGEYWIATNTTSFPIQVYCDMNRTSCSCNTAGGWMRVANLDMTDPNQNCPNGFILVNRTTPPLRTCGRPGPIGCASTTYPTYGVEYSRVCGRVIGYQDRIPNGFIPYIKYNSLLDDIYVDGVSLTHGQAPRQHIWTFVNAVDESRGGNHVCFCTRPDLTYTGVVPPYVGQDYFCETGSRQKATGLFYADDPLWDGQGCASGSTCCEFNNPPWFCKQLPQPTTDDIEIRLCGDQDTGNEDSPLELVDIYIR
ncbi:mucin-3A-like isoform X2 [Halichondria panicea]|uniref:mucin-3A-like isoform X2 n=1 Tax=Halichondria panicea TaxID=6063 RepID=UPI00312B6FFE